MTTENINKTDVLTQAQQLPKEIKPERDLWIGIEQAIAQTPQQKKYQAEHKESSYWGQIGKVAAAITPFALVLGIWLNSMNGFNREPSAQDQWLNPLVASYDIQKKQLLQHVNLAEPIVDNWQNSMQELVLAEQALIKALQHQPEDPALMKMLNQVYKNQINLIKKTYQPQLKRYQQI